MCNIVDILISISKISNKLIQWSTNIHALSYIHTWTRQRTRQNEHWRAYRCGHVTGARQTAFRHLPNRLRQNEHYSSRVGNLKWMRLSFVLTLPHSMLWRTKNLLSLVHERGTRSVHPASFKCRCGFTHGYQLWHTDSPICSDCNTIFPIDYILND